jgi:MurNAc alpha-1-phosphate uridylyltransferase
MAAGLGTRMRPITDNIPKPMIKVNGQTLIEFAIEKLLEVDVEKIVINLHYKAKLLQDFILSLDLPAKLQLIFSHEDELLEAGGTVKALPYFNNEAFYVLNSDNIWTDDEVPALRRLAQGWRPSNMDLLLLMQNKKNVMGHDKNGDLNLVEDGHLFYYGPNAIHDHVFIGPRIISPNFLKDQNVTKFHLFIDFIFKNKVKINGELDRIYGIEHKGSWLDIGNIVGLKQAEQFLKKI